MNMLDKYISEVGKHLPHKNRADIEAEIRSTLQDMLDDRSRESGKPADEAMVSAVLKEYGAPANVAASYKPTQYLIGPRLYPVFELVIKIVLTVLFAVALAGLGISMTARPSGPEFSASLGKFALQIFGGVVSAFGNIVLIFAILERILPASEFEKGQKEWDPAELARAPDPDSVKRVESILTVVFTVIWLTVLNLYSNVIGIGFVADGKWIFIPVLSEAFFRYLPWINLLGIVQIGFNLFLLSQNVWRTGTRLADLAIKVAEIVLAFAMLTGPSLVAISPEALAGTPLAESGDMLVRLFRLGLTIALTVVIVVGGVEIVQAIYRLVTRRTLPAFPVVK